VIALCAGDSAGNLRRMAKPKPKRCFCFISLFRKNY